MRDVDHYLQGVTELANPVPGHLRAASVGCVCPAPHGEWAPLQGDGELLFWVAEDCPIHAVGR